MNKTMRTNSRLPFSAQTSIHENLPRLLERHIAAPFRKPCVKYNRSAFDESMAQTSYYTLAGKRPYGILFPLRLRRGKDAFPIRSPCTP